jgi:outer membrane protein TolC
MLARDATRTDEAQADSRIARGIAERESADGTRRATRSAYARVVGGEPGENPRPAALPPAELLPQSIDEARRLFANNPDVRASTFAITVADAETDVAWAGLLPDIALRGTMRRLNQQDSPNLGRDTKEIVVALNIPLYEAGVAAARVRESKHTTGQRQIELDQTRRRILDSITRAWEQVAASRARIAALQQQIRAGQVAVDSLKAEVRVGSRTLTEQLDAEQDLLNARIELQRAQRDEIVGSYQLAALVGNLTAEKLRLPVEIYDPREHLERTRGRFTGTDTLVDYPPPSPPAR